MFRPGQEHPFPPSLRHRELVEQAFGDIATRHEVGLDPVAHERSSVPGPIAAIRHAASARPSRPRRKSPSKKAATPLADVNTSQEYASSIGSVNPATFDGDRRELDHGGPERLQSLAQLAGLFARPGHDDGATEQRAVLEPSEVEPATSPTTMTAGDWAANASMVPRVARVVR